MVGGAGQEVEPLKSEEIVTGDRVKCEVDPALFGDPEMADKIGLVSLTPLFSEADGFMGITE